MTKLQQRIGECLKLTRVLQDELLRHVLEDALLALSPAQPETKWKQHDGIPNLKAHSFFYEELDLPIVTRLLDGTWWEHPPVGNPQP